MCLQGREPEDRQLSSGESKAVSSGMLLVLDHICGMPEPEELLN